MAGQFLLLVMRKIIIKIHKIAIVSMAHHLWKGCQLKQHCYANSDTMQTAILSWLKCSFNFNEIADNIKIVLPAQQLKI